MVTALSVYSTNTNATTLSTARLLVTGTGAGSTNTFTSKCGTSTGYSELYGPGTTNAWAAAGSIGSPSGNGFLLDVTTLEGQQIVAGNWTVRFRGKVSVGTLTVDIYVRAYIFDGTNYTQIGSTMSLTGQSVTTTSTNFDFSPASLAASATFPTGGKLYIDCWPNITTNSSGSSTATFSIVESFSSTQGNVASFKIDTPGYQTGVTTVTKTLQTRLLLRVQNTKTLGVRLRERVQNTKTLATRFLERTQVTKTLGVRLRERVQITKTLATRFLERTQITKTLPVRFILQKVSVTKTLAVRFLERTQITKTLPVRTLLRVGKTVTLPIRLVMVKSIKVLQVRARIRTLLSKTAPFRTRLSTKLTKTLAFRLVERTLATKTLPFRTRIALAAVTKVLQTRLRLRTQRTTSLPVRFILTTARRLTGGFTLFASGTGTLSFDHFRVTQYPDPALWLDPIDARVGSTLVAWNATVPTNTTLGIDTSRDGVNWTDVSSGNGGTIPGIIVQPDPVIDGFDANSSASYTSGNLGGSNGTWTWDTANSRITGTGGTNATLLYSPLVGVSDGFVEIDLDSADNAGCICNYIDANNCYFIRVWDASGTTQQNLIQLFRRAAGTSTQIGSSAAISFTRLIPHRIRLDNQAGVLTVLFDGTTVISYADGSPLASGKFGLLENSATGMRCYQIRMQQYGDVATGWVYTRARLATTDPSATPQVADLTTSARGPQIANGALITQLHDPGKPFAEFYDKELASLAKASGDYYWNVDTASELIFQPRHATPSPWILHSQDLLNAPTVTPLSSADLYRNRQTITNCIGVTDQQYELKIADGSTSSWNMAYPLYSAPTIHVGGVAKTVGVQGVDTSKDFYWQQGSVAIGQDNAAPKLADGSLVEVWYVGQFETSVTRDNLTEQAARALVETGTSGIVEAVEDGKGMLASAAIVYADGLLARYGSNNAVELQGDTERSGLKPGMLLSAFVAEHGLMDRQLLVTKVTTVAEQKADGSILYTYSITATDGANLTDWASVFF
jgi:hypothetical protein